MTFAETQLHLVNRTLRRSGYCDAFDHEEPAIHALATQGVATDWIAAQVRSQRTARALEASTPTCITWDGSIER